jgi:cytochrome c-type biogenesis protein CcmH/NrfG
LLSREGRDEFGFVSTFDTATAAKMREMLKKAIALNPTFTESYELLAFVNLVNNEELDDAVAQL